MEFKDNHLWTSTGDSPDTDKVEMEFHDYPLDAGDFVNLYQFNLEKLLSGEQDLAPAITALVPVRGELD